MGNARPLLDYLSSSTTPSLESFELAGLNASSNTMKHLLLQLSQCIDDHATARLARLIRDYRCLPTRYPASQICPKPLLSLRNHVLAPSPVRRTLPTGGSAIAIESRPGKIGELAGAIALLSACASRSLPAINTVHPPNRTDSPKGPACQSVERAARVGKELPSDITNGHNRSVATSDRNAPSRKLNPKIRDPISTVCTICPRETQRPNRQQEQPGSKSFDGRIAFETVTLAAA
jgi:hypothetical protein